MTLPHWIMLALTPSMIVVGWLSYYRIAGKN